MKIQFQTEKGLDTDKFIGKPITRWGVVIGKVTHYNYCNGYAGAEIEEKFDERLCRDMGIPIVDY